MQSKHSVIVYQVPVGNSYHRHTAAACCISPRGAKRAAVMLKGRRHRVFMVTTFSGRGKSRVKECTKPRVRLLAPSPSLPESLPASSST